MDAFLLQLAGCLDAFPCGGNLDEYAFAGNAGCFVQRHDFARFLHGGFGVEGEAGIHLTGNAAGHALQNLQTECDDDAVHEFADFSGGVGDAGLEVGHHGIKDGAVFRFGGSCQDEGGIGGSILWGEFFHLAEVACVCYDGGVLFQLFELCCHNVTRLFYQNESISASRQ